MIAPNDLFIPGRQSELDRALTQWDRVVEELSHPDVELTPDEFLPVLQCFKALSRAGYAFDRGFGVVMGKLEAQLVHSSADSDSDDDANGGAWEPV